MGTNKLPRQSPELKKQRFWWLDHQVLPDPELPASAKLVAYRIGDGFNDRDSDGRAWESCKEIANAIAMSEATVIMMVRRLDARGHLRVEWGQQGRGRPNNYWLILKPQPAKVFDEIKPQPTQVLDGKIKPQSATRKPQPTKIKPQPTKIKPQPAKESHCTSQEESQGKSHAQRALAPQNDFLAGSSAAEDIARPAAGFKDFWSVYPKQVGRRAAEREYKKALQEGATAEEINAGARRYAADPVRIERSRESDRYTKDPNNWLKEGRWADKPAGVHRRTWQPRRCSAAVEAQRQCQRLRGRGTPHSSPPSQRRSHMSNDIIEFPASGVGHVLHEPLRRFAPASRAVAKCKRDLATVLNPHADDPPLSRKELHELMLPRIAEVLSAVQLLDAIVNGGEVIAPELIIKLLTLLQSTISTQKSRKRKLQHRW
jgi:hypothetical protein